jgi:hypothetical protein
MSGVIHDAMLQYYLRVDRSIAQLQRKGKAFDLTSDQWIGGWHS